MVRLSGFGFEQVEKSLLDRPARVGRVCRRAFLDREKNLIDDGLALRFKAPNSFTGEDVLELQGHGGPAVMARLLQRCIELGARLAEPGEFSLRAYQNGKIDLTQAEAIADLVNASTIEAAKMAAATMKGAVSDKSRGLAAIITEARGDIEASIDFSDEDITPDSEDKILATLREAEKGLRQLTADCRRSLDYGSGSTMALVGEPNAGKSSILNLVCSRHAAIVDETPGTTRDIVSVTCDIKGVPVTLLDTAGLREGGGRIEREGMRLAKEAIENASHVVLIHDFSSGKKPYDIGTLPSLTVFNKTDLCEKVPQPKEREVFMSAKTGEGLDMLLEALAALCGASGETPPFLARERHAVALEKAADEVKQAIEAGLEMTEVPAEHLRLAQDALASITGEVSADDLLGEIFSKFCVGK